MEGKVKVVSPTSPNSVEIVGLDAVVAQVAAQENMLCKYEKYADDILLACSMPEIPRYVLADEEMEGTRVADAFDAVQRLLVRYRKITAWMRKNGIDVEAVAGGGDAAKSKS